MVSNIESALPPLASVLAFAVVAPVAEEFIFRRLLLDRIRIFGDGAGYPHRRRGPRPVPREFESDLLRLRRAPVLPPIVLMTNRIRYTIAIHMFINGISVLSTFENAQWFLYPMAMLILFSVLFSIVLFFVRHKRYTFEPGPLPFTSQEKLRACFASPWVWLLFLGGLAFSSVAIFL